MDPKGTSDGGSMGVPSASIFDGKNPMMDFDSWIEWGLYEIY